MAPEPVLHAFNKDIFQLGTDPEDMRNTGRTRCHELFPVLFELQQIKIISAPVTWAARCMALSEQAKRENPGGNANAFWLPVIIISIPSSSIGIGSAENDETVSR